MSGFTRKAGAFGVRASWRLVAASVVAMAKHPFGFHDMVDELDYELVDGEITCIGTERFCWLCRAKEYST